ncbi:amino acid/amide ABC transporter ATP-binding protein 1, HAAT family [Faunimonas pinastri]|uniref:Amino acid/amide ABC transporter ATP-binding protein 1, HAAT family n=1 Tax=Faunimonas pinastri TaxID=1855383 RepID=A0A1H9BZU9_9HYPH|nr:ABC transporter ATP-binding protein [Faunimonas pinastri]SEP94083.1 amino acid/amide ABC transporter ATP-binding protein 1, HAAT family [Faunimonas pinastri]
MQVERGADSSRPEGEPLLVAEGIVKRFGGVAAVDGVSFALRRGEILGLIGPNGAGKTTLFDCLAGSQSPSEGRILMRGRPVERLPAWRRLEAGLGRTFQIPRPFPEMTVLENVLLGRQGAAGETILPNWLQPGRVRREEAESRERAMVLLDFVTLAKLANEPARVLSGGQRKLLELARVLMAEPEAILLDEPAAGVNPSLLEVIMERIRDLNARGTTFLLIEHNMDMVARLCGRVLVMASGQLLMTGTHDEVVRDRRVVDAYLGGVAA